MVLTVDQASYLAGAIDGEGSLAVYGVRRTATGTPSHHARVTICNTNKAWLETLQTWVGGYLVKVGPARGRFNRKQQYRLELKREGARDVLRQIYPYLIIKKRHADLLFEYFAIAQERRTANLPGRRCDPLIIQRIDDIVVALKKINLRGLVPPAPRKKPCARMCSITTCERAYYSNGYCKQHYKKYVERGGPSWHERKCIVCGKPFVARRSDARACSKSCSDRAWYRTRSEASRAPSPTTPEAVVQTQAVGDGAT